MNEPNHRFPLVRAATWPAGAVYLAAFAVLSVPAIFLGVRLMGEGLLFVPLFEGVALALAFPLSKLLARAFRVRIDPTIQLEKKTLAWPLVAGANEERFVLSEHTVVRRGVRRPAPGSRGASVLEVENEGRRLYVAAPFQEADAALDEVPDPAEEDARVYLRDSAQLDELERVVRETLQREPYRR